MTATAVAQPTGVSDKDWVRLFPKEVTENYTSSITFIKQLTVVAVSTITYLKNAFPEESYSSESFGGLKLKLLKDRCDDALAQFVSTSMRQAFAAFDNKYVHQLALCFYRGDCTADNLIEYHAFEYSYTPEGVALTINTKNRESSKRTLRCSVEAVRNRTAMLVRSMSMFVWESCARELPNNYNVSLRLYYNEDAPEGYQAPGFSPSLGPEHLESSADETMCMGWVETPFHKFIARSFVRDSTSDSDAAVPSDNVPEMTQDGSGDYGEWGARPGSGDAERPRCPCGGTDREQLVTCQYCHTQQHLVCFGLVAAPAAHCCVPCAAREPRRTPSCLMLAGLEPRKQECVCIFRRTLVLCAQQRAVRGVELRARFGLSAPNAQKMLRLLQSHDVLPHADTQDLSLLRKINPIRLKMTFKLFFRTEDREESTVERLVSDTERAAGDPLGEGAGGGSPGGRRGDPLGEALASVSLREGAGGDRGGAGSPGGRRGDPLGEALASVSLREGAGGDRGGAGGGSPGGRRGDAAGEDPTLQQYRQVVVPEAASEELPLSGDHNPVDVARVAAARKRRTARDDDEDWRPTKLTKLRSGAKTKKKL